jgi:NAD/NADP transhydrogenase beta subunit
MIGMGIAIGRDAVQAGMGLRAASCWIIVAGLAIGGTIGTIIASASR